MTAHVDKRSADDEIADLGTAEHHLQVRQTAIYVYEWPVRLWHWVNAAAPLAFKCLPQAMALQWMLRRRGIAVREDEAERLGTSTTGQRKRVHYLLIWR